MRRRQLLQAIPGLFALSGFSRFAIADDVDAPPIIDTHTHFYDPSRPEGVPWPGEGSPLYRTVLPEHFREVAEPLGVQGTVVVEASPWVEDNQWVLNLAKSDTIIRGVVGHLEPGAAEFADHLARLITNHRFRGIRVSAGPLSEGLERTEFLSDLADLAERGLVLDVNGSPAVLPLVARLAAELPELNIVINHVANVGHDGGEPDAGWAAGMRAAAEHERVVCKVSALTEGAARDGTPAPTDPEFYRPVLDVVWHAFGEERLLFGSNWPVCETAGTLETVVTIARSYFGEKDREAQEKFFAANARRVYAWPEPSA